MAKNVKKEIFEIGVSEAEVVKKFIKDIGANKTSDTSFTYNGEKWFIDKHPFDHSDDIIVEESEAKKYDKFLLIKVGGDRIRIVGWCDRETLMRLPPTDIYRNNTNCYVVMDTNVNDLSFFNLVDENLVLKTEFTINQQEAENLGHTEMISGILAGFHKFAKEANIMFKDINQKDEFIVGDRKAKIYTRDYLSDEDMLIYEEYFQKHPEIDLYILCKIKGGKYSYLGYVEKSVVAETRVVQMLGGEDETASASGDIRRIFAEQYKPISDIVEIWEEKTDSEENIEEQRYVPLHVHSEFSIGDGFGKTSYMAETLKKKGFKACALTDHGTLAGVWEFQKSCLLNGIKPIIGCEFYMGFSDRTKERFHLTVLAKDEKGWLNLLKLQSIGTRKGFYYFPIIKLDDILENNEGLVVMAGCAFGLIPFLIHEGKMEEAKQYSLMFKEKFKDDFYFEIQPHTIEDNQKVMQKLYELSKELNIKCVFTNDVHYPKKEDKVVHDAIKAISYKRKFGEAGFGDDCFYFMTEDDVKERIKEKCNWMEDKYEEWFANTLEISEKCNYTITPGEEQDTLPKLDMEYIKEHRPNLYAKYAEWKEKAKQDPSLLILSNHPEVENE